MDTSSEEPIERKGDLFRACYYGETERVKQFSQARRADLQRWAGDALRGAAAGGRVELLGWLVAQGLPVDAASSSGTTARGLTTDFRRLAPVFDSNSTYYR